MFVLINFAFSQSPPRYPYFSQCFTIKLEGLVFQSPEGRGHGDSLNQNWRRDPEFHWSLDTASLFQEGGKKSAFLLPCDFLPSYTVLNSLWLPMTPHSMLNFCSAAKSAPFFSWILYLCFLSDQFSKHTWSTYCIRGMMESTGSLICQYVLCFYNI